MSPEADRNFLLPSSITASITELCAGEQEAVATLLTDMKHDLQSYGARFKLQPSDLDDLVSECVLTLLAKDPDFENGLPGIRAWLHATFRVNALALWRRRARARLQDAGEDAVERLGVSEDPLAGLEGEAQRAFLAARIPMLSSAQQLVVLLRLTNHDWNSVAWICSHAEGQAVTVNAVRCRCGQAVERLREEYERVG